MFRQSQLHLCKAAWMRRKQTRADGRSIVLPLIRALSTSDFHASRHSYTNDQRNALLLVAAVAACSALTTNKQHSSTVSPVVKCDNTASAVSSAQPTTTLVSSNVMNPNEKPRNIMLHRMRSMKARSLVDKYDINWNVVLGEGAYGAVYPGKLHSTGEKVKLLTCKSDLTSLFIYFEASSKSLSPLPILLSL